MLVSWPTSPFSVPVELAAALPALFLLFADLGGVAPSSICGERHRHKDICLAALENKILPDLPSKLHGGAIGEQYTILRHAVLLLHYGYIPRPVRKPIINEVYQAWGCRTDSDVLAVCNVEPFSVRLLFGDPVNGYTPLTIDKASTVRRIERRELIINKLFRVAICCHNNLLAMGCLVSLPH